MWAGATRLVIGRGRERLDPGRHFALYSAQRRILHRSRRCKWLQVVTVLTCDKQHRELAAACRIFPSVPRGGIGLAASRVDKCENCRCCLPSDWRADGIIGTTDTFGNFRTSGWIWHFIPMCSASKICQPQESGISPGLQIADLQVPCLWPTSRRILCPAMLSVSHPAINGNPQSLSI